MQFEYTAVNNENKKLNGFINATDEEAARKQLNSLGLAVLSIHTNENTEPEAAEVEEKIKFEALDKTGKKIIGTIPETDKSKAFKRLIEEYNFEVLALYPLNATEEQKEQARANIMSIKTTYELNKAQEETDGILSDDEKTVRKTLIDKVEFIIGKIESILETFGDQIKPAEITHINNIKDKLLRLKHSNNLNFIKETTEELLKMVQDKEIYLHQDTFVKGREKIKLDTQKLLLEVDKINTTPSMRIFGNDSKIARKFNLDVFRKSETEEVTQLKAEVKELNTQLLDYYRIWITSSKSMKPEVTTKLKELRSQKKEILNKIKSIKKAEKLAKRAASDRDIEGDLTIVTGWLLTFYIAYYFVNYYLSFKSHFLNQYLDWQGNIFESPVFSYLILGVFFLHILLKTKTLFMPKNGMYNYIAYPLLTIAIILININF